MRIGVRIPPFARVDHLLKHVQEAERLGFDDVWFPDSQLLWRDVFSTLAVAALNTERIRLGTAVTNVVTRHPSVIASAARTVAELAPDRFVLGLGVGNSSLAPIGLRASRQPELRSAIGAIRGLLAGEECQFGEQWSRLRDPGPHVPIYVAATGPRNLQLAGEIADGVILLSGVSESTLRRATELVALGHAAGVRPSAPPLTVSAYCQITDDLERDARRLKPICAGIAQGGGQQALRAMGIVVQVPDRIDGVYPDLVHAEDWEAAMAACDRYISDADAVRFAQQFCLFGTADDVVAGIARAARAGATSIFLQHVGSYDPPREMMAAFADQVLPRLATGGTTDNGPLLP